jgi:putative ABC transport system permease protein
MILKMAWRNIWRNKRRTAITAASVLFAVFFALILRSAQVGYFSQLIDNILQSYTGYIQIHKPGYRNEKDINNSFKFDDSISLALNKLSNIKMFVPRLESYALASYGQQTKGIALIGTDPDQENKFSSLKKKIIDGNYFEKGDSSVLVAQRLAKFLNIKVNDTLVLISQGYHAVGAAGKFRVKGIIKFSSPELDKTMVYMSLAICQSYFSAENRLTSISINLNDKEKINDTAADLKSTLDNEKYEILKWDEILTEIVELVDTKTTSGMILMGILYMVVAFGVFGTVLMMTVERIKEFGLMVSMGMQKTKLAIMVFLETVFLGFLGTIGGIIIGFPIIARLSYHPIRLTGDTAAVFEQYGMEAVMPLALQANIFMVQAIVILIIVLIASGYPVWRILKLKEINALRSKL